MSTPQEAGAYQPRPGDRVTVRRYVKPFNAERSLDCVRTGTVTGAYPAGDGSWRFWLDTCNEQLTTEDQAFRTYWWQTEVELTEPAPHRFQLTPDLALLLDDSQCIVAEVSDGASGHVLRRVTITDVDALKAALDALRAAQGDALAEGRRRGLDERRRAQGRLTKSEAVRWLIERRGWGAVHGTAVRAVGDIGRGEDTEAARAAAEEGLAYDGTYWTVP